MCLLFYYMAGMMMELGTEENTVVEVRAYRQYIYADVQSLSKSFCALYL